MFASSRNLTRVSSGEESVLIDTCMHVPSHSEQALACSGAKVGAGTGAGAGKGAGVGMGKGVQKSVLSDFPNFYKNKMQYSIHKFKPCQND